MHNINYTHFPTKGCEEGSMAMIIGIQEDTTLEKFESLRLQYPNYRVGHGEKVKCTALVCATMKANLILINRIVELGGKALFLLSFPSNKTPGLSPLHAACDLEDLEKAYLATKKLLQLGSPVNLSLDPGCLKEDSPEESTPLDLAIKKGHTKVATLLLRNGGIALNQNIAAARKNLMTQNEMCFVAFCENNQVPKDILNYILSYSVKVELKD